eukprot:CAMPEP_0196579664 /NCGR_PEP_ID=MMETSP1081-20130531/24362_1 /TAXON_ID=36882 /ORGANISM="Pyramimonas amylifera, Strain CCMP720" /LENGTH=307 /DNA_ID=CAMNT_0041899313 /DNA_START=219 /DNA_END=1142 /DNA_ORIENTATION=+
MSLSASEVLHLDAELKLDCKNILGESIVWCPERSRLFWVDIEGMLFHELDPESGDLKLWDLPERAGSVALKEDGGFLFAFASGLAEYNLKSGAISKQLAVLEVDLPSTRLNDGRCDRQGRFVVGGFNEKQAEDGGQPLSGIYRLAADGSVVRLVEEGVRCSNSICFSLDGSRMYFADSPTRKIYMFDYSGELPTNKTLFYEMPESDPGIPDGSTVDSEGNIWNAEFMGARVVRHRASDGVIDTIVHLPVPNPTQMALGGPDLDTLYITTARRKMSDEQLAAAPTAGGIFAVKVPIKGVIEPKFKSIY